MVIGEGAGRGGARPRRDGPRRRAASKAAGATTETERTTLAMARRMARIAHAATVVLRTAAKAHATALLRTASATSARQRTARARPAAPRRDGVPTRRCFGGRRQALTARSSPWQPPTRPRAARSSPARAGLVGRALLGQPARRRPHEHVDVVARQPARRRGDARDPKLTVKSGDMAALRRRRPVASTTRTSRSERRSASPDREAAFRAVDLDLVVAIARRRARSRARAVSASSPRSAPTRPRASSTTASRARWKGARRARTTRRSRSRGPSLLVGDRAALGQPARRGEVWAARLLGPLMPARSRRRAADRSVCRRRGAARRARRRRAGRKVLTSAAMQRWRTRARSSAPRFIFSAPALPARATSTTASC
jgi:hypothetical protein